MIKSPLFALFCALAPLLAAAWTTARGPWVYDQSAKTLTSADGATVLPGVAVYGAAADKNLQMGKCTADIDVDELDFSAGVADGWKILRLNQTFDWQNSTNHLKSVILSDETEWASGWLFRNSTQIESFVAGANFKTIGGSAFQNCTALTNCALPEGMESVGNRFLAGASNLKYFRVPSTLTDIPGGAFSSAAFTNDFVWPATARGDLLPATFTQTAFARCHILTGPKAIRLSAHNDQLFSSQKLEEVVFPNTLEVFDTGTSGATLFSDMRQPMKLYWRACPTNFFGAGTKRLSFNGWPYSIKHYIAKQNLSVWEKYAAEKPEEFTMPTGTEEQVAKGRAEAGLWKQQDGGGTGMPVYIWRDPWADPPPGVLIVR